MARMRVVLTLGALVAALALAGCGGGDDEASGGEAETTIPETLPETGDVLRASVGPGFEISLTTDDGTAVETLPAGSYTILTDDKAAIHNFRLTGEGVDIDTGIAETGTDSFDVTFSSGTYRFVCEPHAGSMNGSFEVSG